MLQQSRVTGAHCMGTDKAAGRSFSDPVRGR